jgi:hypothetical protein
VVYLRWGYYKLVMYKGIADAECDGVRVVRWLNRSKLKHETNAFQGLFLDPWT